jgi:hypothetical protein
LTPLNANTKTYRLETIHQAVTIGTTLERSWFRGHSREVGTLRPGIFRAVYNNPVVAGFRPDIELETILRFKRDAPAISDQLLPGPADHLGWLCLMQHHRCPTRLFDWTESALIGLYFAVSADHSKDGELWAMLPWALNNRVGAGWGVPLLTSPIVRFLVEQPFWAGTPEGLAKLVGVEGRSRAQ